MGLRLFLSTPCFENAEGGMDVEFFDVVVRDVELFDSSCAINVAASGVCGFPGLSGRTIDNHAPATPCITSIEPGSPSAERDATIVNEEFDKACEPVDSFEPPVVCPSVVDKMIQDAFFVNKRTVEQKLP